MTIVGKASHRTRREFQLVELNFPYQGGEKKKNKPRGYAKLYETLWKKKGGGEEKIIRKALFSVWRRREVIKVRSYDHGRKTTKVK